MPAKFLLNTLCAPQWKAIGIKKHHGINTPLFSLRSKNSSGIGEFLDLKLLIDWLHPLGFDVIQLLPLNDLGDDTSPYNSISSNALNPIYISLEFLPDIKKDKDLMERIKALKHFNQTERIHYTEIKKAKDEILYSYAQKKASELHNDPNYLSFIESNLWLEPYAIFKALKMRYKGENSHLWPKSPDLHGLEPDIHTAKIIQYLAFSQMESVKAYATEKGVFLMGDLPILVSPDSVDVWTNPHLFDMEYYAGAPPDHYSLDGQVWGFPLYNFKELEKENFFYWKERLQFASKLYHIYRIDHIIGLFRIWAVPKGKSGREGHFIPEDRSLWRPQGETLLKFMCENFPMLPIGEDLGIDPEETREVMHSLGVCGTKVIFWERHWDKENSFIPFSEYPPDSLTTLSTHDSESFRVWWESNPLEAKAFAECQNLEYQEKLSEKEFYELLKTSHKTPSLFHINLLHEYLGLFPELTWEKPREERINFPGIVSPFNWTFRYKCTIEEMAAHPKLSKALKGLHL